MKKKILSFFLLFCVTISSFAGVSVTASAWTGIGITDDPWLIGKNNPDDVTAVYDYWSKTLTISGSGEMTDYFSANIYSIERMPWINCSDDMKTVIIKNGVSSIADFTFLACYNITSMDIPGSVKRIGESAFYDCWGLKELTLNEGLISIGTNAFFGCSALETLKIPASVNSLGDNLFFNCSALKTIYFGGTQEQWKELTKKIDIPASVTSIICKEPEPDDKNEDESEPETTELKPQKTKITIKPSVVTIKSGKSKTIRITKLFSFKSLMEDPTITYSIIKPDGLSCTLKKGRLTVTGKKKGTFKIKITIHINETENYAARDVDATLKIIVK